MFIEKRASESFILAIPPDHDGCGNIDITSLSISISIILLPVK